MSASTETDVSTDVGGDTIGAPHLDSLTAASIISTSLEGVDHSNQKTIDSSVQRCLSHVNSELSSLCLIARSSPPSNELLFIQQYAHVPLTTQMTPENSPVFRGISILIPFNCNINTPNNEIKNKVIN